MSACIRARDVRIVLRKKPRGEPEEYTVVCPARWTKGTFLAYCRAEHPGYSVRILDWPESGMPDDPWTARLWLANPRGFHDFVRGVR